MRGYEFADPSIVRAFYNPEAPLEGRNMLLTFGFSLGRYELWGGYENRSRWSIAWAVMLVGARLAAQRAGREAAPDPSG